MHRMRMTSKFLRNTNGPQKSQTNTNKNEKTQKNKQKNKKTKKRNKKLFFLFPLLPERETDGAQWHGP